FAKLEQAAQRAVELTTLLAEVNSEKVSSRAGKKIRDQAYVYLKEVVNEITRHGKFLFRDNEERRNGYRSKYLRKINVKSQSKPKPNPES
ncbi:MAG: hypothetical protein GY757_11195, partial [bacterium]|nr:hypothetical protein [bacterium]